MIFQVKSPILGFEHIKSYELIELDQFFIKLQSKDDESELRIYNIMVVSTPIETSTVNFIAPIVCNMTNMTLSQIVLDAWTYPMYKQAEKISDFIVDQK